MGGTVWPTMVRKNHVARSLHWLATLGRFWGRSHAARQLFLRETLTLGERRFLAVVEFEQQKFLIAGTGSSVAMLTALGSPGTVARGGPESSPSEFHGEVPRRSPTEHQEIPTWEFSGLGEHWQLIRRGIGNR